MHTGSTVQRRQLGRLLKQAREEAGIALMEAGRQMEFSRAKMYRIEAGQASLRVLDVEEMCRLYDTSDESTEVMLGLAGESKTVTWWQAYGDALPSWFEMFVGLESAANHIRTYQSTLIPGLLQTREYARALLAVQPGTTGDEIEQRAELRLERQRLLKRRRPKAPKVEVIVDEGVLHRFIPDTAAMQAQLAHLANAPHALGVSVRVVPFGAGLYHGSVAGSFSIFDFPHVSARPREPSTVYCEGLSGALYLDRPDEVAQYAEAWQQLDSLALSQRESELLISSIIRESTDD